MTEGRMIDHQLRERASRAISSEESVLTGRIIGSAMVVHKCLGPGFLESIYQDALEIQFALDQVDHRREHEIQVPFRGHLLGIQRLDFFVEGAVVVELKAVSELSSVHRAQLRSYLKAAGVRIGLLINFNQELLQVKRVLNG